MTALALPGPERTWRVPRIRHGPPLRQRDEAATLLGSLWAAGWLMPYGAPLLVRRDERTET
ncbi:MAG TPA: hypothetical protein VFB26_10560 [Gaiellaceae bacterium]|nr:hypothetical protein [Gaiellaceae bacterium]